MLFLDFKKAFDCVDHSILLQKLQRYGITGQLHSLITSFITDRMQYVSVNQISSRLLPIEVGVPQGSILAPTLFLIYVNDLLSYTMYSKSFAYADDTVFILESEDLRTLFHICNIDLYLIGKWCKANRMVLNTKKSNYMILKPQEPLIWI